MERLQFPRKWYIYRKIPTVTQVFCPEHLVTESRFLFYLSRHTQTHTHTQTQTHTQGERETHTQERKATDSFPIASENGKLYVANGHYIKYT